MLYTVLCVYLFFSVLKTVKDSALASIELFPSPLRSHLNNGWLVLLGSPMQSSSLILVSHCDVSMQLDKHFERIDMTITGSDEQSSEIVFVRFLQPCPSIRVHRSSKRLSGNGLFKVNCNYRLSLCRKRLNVIKPLQTNNKDNDRNIHSFVVRLLCYKNLLF